MLPQGFSFVVSILPKLPQCDEKIILSRVEIYKASMQYTIVT